MTTITTRESRTAAKASQIGMLQTVGEALYGEHWQTALARQLSMTDRNIRRWMAGEGIPDTTELAALLGPHVARHRDTLIRLARDLGV